MILPGVYRVAAEVPAAAATNAGGGSLPSTAEAFKTVVETGILGALLVISLGAIAALWYAYNKRQTTHDTAMAALRAEHDKERDEWHQQLSELQDHRIELLERVLNGLSTATAAATMQATYTAELKVSSNQLQEQVRLLVSANSEARTAIQGRLEEVASQGRTNATSLERLSYQRPAPQ